MITGVVVVLALVVILIAHAGAVARNKSSGRGLPFLPIVL
jgi:hypothetical protein